MHMAFASVGPLGAVLGRMGLSYLLQPEDVPAPFSLCAMPSAPASQAKAAPPWQARQSAATRPSWRQQQDRPPSQPRQQRPAYQEPQRQRPASQQPRPAPTPAPQQRPAAWQARDREEGVQRQAASKGIPFNRLAPEAWPAPWQALRSRMKQAWLCWTYWELGEDLCGTPDPGRRQTLGKLIASLQRPAGTNTFWPPALPAETQTGQNGLVASRDLFWSGVKDLGVRMVVAMGYRASVAIGLPREDVKPLHWEIHNGIIVCTTWDFFRIAEQESRLGDIVTYLNSTIRQLGL